MTNQDDNGLCSTPDNMPISGCKVESVISIDDRGQMVLPKDVRERANLRSGDKLTLISWEKDGQICCFSLIKVEDLAGLVKDLLGPMMKDVLG